MKLSIAATMRKIHRWPLNKQYWHLCQLALAEPPRSVRRAELEAALSEVVMRDLKAGNKGLKRNAA